MPVKPSLLPSLFVMLGVLACAPLASAQEPAPGGIGISDTDTHADLREGVRAVCAQFDGA